MLKNIDHPLPSSKLGVIYSKASISSITNKYDTANKADKSRTNSVSNRPTKIWQLKKTKNPKTRYFQKQFRCFYFD